MDESEASREQASSSASVPPNDDDMMDLLAGSQAGFRSLRRGEIVEGTVVHVGRDEVLVDIGTKAEAIVPAHEVGMTHGDIASVVSAGDTIVAMVIDPENVEGHAVLSLARAQAERGWRRLQQVFEQGETLEARVVEFNRGGVIVHIDGVRGFVPVSQIVDLRQGGAPDDSTDARLERMVGRVLALKVIELNRGRNRLILSERAADQERRSRERDRLIEDLEENQVRTGRVSSIADFGAFVDLGGADGLVHITELSWTPVSHPSQVVKVGDQVEVLVLGVDRERKKIALSLKRLRSEPWADVPQRFHVGQNVTARITKLATFGAFAEVEPGVEGLIHISELSDARIQHPKNVVHEDDVVTVKILRIEPERRRLGLSLRQAQDEAAENETRALPRVYGGVEASDYPADWAGGVRSTTAESRDEVVASREFSSEPATQRVERGAQFVFGGTDEEDRPPGEWMGGARVIYERSSPGDPGTTLGVPLHISSSEDDISSSEDDAPSAPPEDPSERLQ